MKRHIGRNTATDQRCVVVYLQIPNRESHALVVPTDTLPAHIEQAVMEVLESQEGQGDPTLANVLNRRLMPDTGKSILSTLHERGFLQAVSVDQIVMLPQPNMPFPLRGIIEQMGGTIPQNTSSPVAESAADVKYNPYGDTTAVEASENAKAIASNLMFEADLLLQEANKKKETAYRYDPSLRPRTVTSKTKAKVEVEAVVETAVIKKPRSRKKTSV